jgi:hypothetical protein
MFDDLRDSNSPFLEEEQTPPPSKTKKTRDKPGFLGMTSAQRFVLALLMFFMVCACGAFLLILGGKITLPF